MAAARATNGDKIAREALARRVTVVLRDVPLRDAIDSIVSVSHVFIQYQARTLLAYMVPVTVRADHMPLGIVLERALDGTGLRLVSDPAGTISIVRALENGVDSVPSTGGLGGRITDSATGRGVTGVTVKVAGSKLSAITRDSGRFVLPRVPVGEQTLQVKGFGYRPAERTVQVTDGEQVIVRIAVVSVPNLLAGVVTTATGAQDRRKVGQDITVISNVDSVMQTAPIRTVTDLLETRVPGLTISHTSGIPGAPSRLRVRGVSGGLVPGANANNDPILIVDGIRVYAQSSTLRDQNNAKTGATAPSPIDQIDPHAIEKVEVFKGPSASAQFGADAANGVIVITTKRGRTGPMRVGATLDYGLEYLPGTYARPGYYLFNHDASQGTGTGGVECGIDPAGVATPNSFGCVLDSLVPFQALAIPRLDMFGTGTNTGASVTGSGGTAAFQYALTASTTSSAGNFQMPELYQDQYATAYKQAVPAWMRRPNRYGAWSGTGVFTSELTSKLHVEFTSSLTSSDQRQSSAQGQLSVLANNYIDTTAFDAKTIGRYAQKITSHTVTSNNALFASWKRWDWLPLQGTVGMSASDRQDESNVPYGIYSDAAASVLYADLGTTIPAYSKAGYYSYGRPTSLQTTARASGTLFPSSRVVTDLGVDFAHLSTHDVSGVANALTRGVAVPTTLTSGSQSATTTNTGGWFLAPRLTVSNRLFVAPGFRIDSRSGIQKNTSGLSQLLTRPQTLFTNPRSLFRGGLTSLLPKMDLSWIAVDRQGQAPLFGALSFLRPRLAFGTTGIQPDPSWLLRTFQAADPTPVVEDNGVPYPPRLGQFYPGVRLTTIGNPILRPERKRELEYGAEMQFWENRVTLNSSGYVHLRYDAIEPILLAPSAGGLSLQQYRNIGAVRGVGYELTFGVIPVQTAGISWSVQGTLSGNRETLLHRDGTLSVIAMGNGIRLVPGYPLNGRWDRPIGGFVVPDSGHRVTAGNIVLSDSAQYLGAATPGYTLPVSSQLALLGGSLTFDVGFNYEHGLTQFGSGSTQGLINLYLDPQATAGQQAAAMAAYCYVSRDRNIGGSIGGSFAKACARVATLAGVVQTVNVLRWNTVSLGYRVPPKATRRLHVPSMRVAIQGRNLGLWSTYRGKDPDVNGTPVGEATEDNGQIPSPRIWGLHVTLGN